MESNNSRLYFLFFLFTLLFATIISRLFYIQIAKESHYKRLANAQQVKKDTLFAQRGKVFFADEATFLAKNQGYERIAVVPKEVEDLEELAEILAKIFEKDKTEILEKISVKNDPWVIVGEIPIDKTEELNGIKGIYFEPNLERYFPQGEIASHIVGFYGYDKDGNKRVGQYGTEGYYQKELAGRDGFREGIVDGKGEEIFSSFNKTEYPVDGDDFILTLDQNIQIFIEKKVKEIFEKYTPKNATIIVAQPRTGEILAAASLPNFNPNKYQETENMQVFQDPLVSLPFEPGSVFKPITMAAAMEEGVVFPQTTYVDTGEVKIGGYTIRNSDLKAHGTQTMTQVLELSLNTGAVFAQQKLGGEKFTEYVKKFGFGKITNTDLANEKPGNINNILNPRSNEKLIEYANASFGQGIAVTSVQIIQAFSAIANQGRMVEPHIVKKIIHPDKTVEEIKPEEISQVISPETASKLTAMMVSTVKNGYSKKAGVEGYLIAGKTGTAQIPDIERGGYFSDKTIHSFINFAPAFDPQFMVFLKMDEPHGPKFSSESLTPTAKEINQFLFSYFGIPPEEREAGKP